MHRNGTDQKCTVKWNPLKVQTKCSGRKQSITEIYLTLKGTPSEDASWLENRKKCAKISICRLHTVDLFIIHATEVLFWVLQILIPLGAPMFVHSLPMNRKRLAHITTHWALFPHMPAFSMSQTARHKLNGLIVVQTWQTFFGLFLQVICDINTRVPGLVSKVFRRHQSFTMLCKLDGK